MMGLQDRDYYRERYKKASQSDSPRYREPGNNAFGIKYLLYPLFAISALWYGADTLLDKIRNSTHFPAPIANGKEKHASGGVILITDQQGHFRGTALVNNIPMPFLIDIGATKTSIPATMIRRRLAFWRLHSIKYCGRTSH